MTGTSSMCAHLVPEDPPQVENDAALDVDLRHVVSSPLVFLGTEAVALFGA